ncbi:hypothetical protein FRB90_004447, partial [Tulasnella sp. 427]
PSPVLTARQQVVTESNGITKTIDTSTGPNKAVTIGATVAVIIGFVALILIGIWIGSWRRKKNVEFQRSVQEAQNEAKRLTIMGSKSHLSPNSSIGSLGRMDRKASTLSLTLSTTSSFASPDASPTREQGRQSIPVLHQPSPRTPSILVQNSLFFPPQTHSDYPPAPQVPTTSNASARPDARRSLSFPPASEMNRTSYYSPQPVRPSPLSYSMTRPPSSQAGRETPRSSESFELSVKEAVPQAESPPPRASPPPSVAPPVKRKMSRDVSPSDEVLRTPPGLEHKGDTSPNPSVMSGEMGRAM